MERTSTVLREWLATSGLSASTAARRAGVSPSTLHRLLNDQVDPSVGTLSEIALACGIQMDLASRPLSDPRASMAARSMLEEGYRGDGTTRWQERLLRLAESDNPIDIVKAAAVASSPLDRAGATLYSGSVPLARVASAGDASKGAWAVSGAAGLYLPDPSEMVPAVTILWCGNPKAVTQLLAETNLTQTHRSDRATLAVLGAEPELFTGSFSQGIVVYAAPIQIVIDCTAQDGDVAADAVKEMETW